MDNTTLNYYDVKATCKNRNWETADDKTSRMKNSIKDEISDFFMHTSFTALTQIYMANSLWKRIVWIILVVVMLVWMTVQCYWLLDKYYRYPVQVQMDIKMSPVLEFPSVTICNLNPILQSKVKEEPYTPLNRIVSNTVEKTLKEATKDQMRCYSDEYKCKNGACIAIEFVCDGTQDCENDEDENYCKANSCPKDYFRCSTGQCIFISGVCDNRTNCHYVDDDEQNCANHTCQDYFQCDTGNCIPLEWVCDNMSDCFNETDEQNCTNHTCPDHFLKCSSGKCIEPFSVCDNKTDCDGGEDEENCTRNNNENDEFPSVACTEPSQTSTTESTRSKREVHYDPGRRPTMDKVLHFKERQRKNRVSGDTNRLPNEQFLEHEKLFPEVTTGSQINSNFFEKLKDSSLTFALRRVKRSEKTNSANIAARQRNRSTSFNIWNTLEDNAKFDYIFVSRDDEYRDAMTYAYITAKLNPRYVEESGHHKIDMIAACKFGGYQCTPTNFSYFHNHKYGNCYTFNSKSDNSTTLTSRFPGPQNGLILELFVDQENYMENLAPDAGVRVVVHKKGSMPFPEDEGISVMPGRSTSVGIRQVSFFRLPPPHGSCGNRGLTANYYRTYLGTDYSKVACLKSCYQDVIIDYCGCAVPFYYVLDKVTVCNMTDTNIDSCVTDLLHNNYKSYEACDKLCPVPCTETSYKLSVSTALWPSENYREQLKERLNITNSKYIKVNDTNDEFTKLLIYFEDLLYEQVEQQKAYESMNLISDFGGQLGLWLGLSAITLGEVCSFLFGVGKSLWYKCSWKKVRPGQNDLTPVSYIEPANQQDLFEEMTLQPAKYTLPDKTAPLTGITRI